MDAREISGSLPPPRDDEPPSLRQDILDELADHLQCAMRRELLTHDDAAAARQRVLDKFGDPREVARKLWVQAMWSRIMSQRITLGLLALTTAACLLLAGLMWRTTQQSQQVNAMLLEQMAALVAASRTPAPVPPTPDATLKVRLFNGEKGGRPPKWATVIVVGTHLNNASIQGQRDGASGLVEFGVLPPGAYEVGVQTPRGEATRTVKVLRGEPHVEEFVCPDEAGQQVDVVIECDLPEDLKKRDVAMVALFKDEPFEFGGDTWQKSTNGGIFVAVNRAGIRPLQSIWGNFNIPPGTTRDTRANWIMNVFGNEPSPRTKPAASTPPQHWTGGRFKLVFLALATDPGIMAVDLDSVAGADAAVAAVQMVKSDWNGMKGIAEWPAALDVEYVVKEGPPWHIKIPERLIEEARKQLAETPAAKPDERHGTPPAGASKENIDDQCWRTIGVRVADVAPAQLGEYRNRYRGGMRIADTPPDSPAARSGIKPDDILLGLHVWETVNLENVAHVLQHPKLASDDPVKFYVLRGHDIRSGSLRLFSRRSE